MKNLIFNQLFLLLDTYLLCAFLFFCALDVVFAKEHHKNQLLAKDQGIQANNGQISTRCSTNISGVELRENAQSEVHCLALNIYFEARGEPEIGQQAVGHVVMNRVAHPRYPSTVCAVVRQGGDKKRHRCQFSWWCDGLSDRPKNPNAWAQALRLAQQIYAGNLQDITDGALWYHATYVTPYWSKVLLQGDKIGQHIFYLENRKVDQTL